MGPFVDDKILCLDKVCKILLKNVFSLIQEKGYTISNMDCTVVLEKPKVNPHIRDIQKIIADGGSVILMSHLGRPTKGYTKKYSLNHLIQHLSTLLKGKEILFAEDCIGKSAIDGSDNLNPGQILLLENLRFYKEEEKGDLEFAKKLSTLGDIYVNDAFGTAHRAHASTAIIAQFFPGNKCFGYVMAGEVASINKVLTQSEKPFTAIIGGAKVSDKIMIIEQLLICFP